jgi:hypothetical protein
MVPCEPRRPLQRIQRPGRPGSADAREVGICPPVAHGATVATTSAACASTVTAPLAAHETPDRCRDVAHQLQMALRLCAARTPQNRSARSSGAIERHRHRSPVRRPHGVGRQADRADQRTEP